MPFVHFFSGRLGVLCGTTVVCIVLVRYLKKKYFARITAYFLYKFAIGYNSRMHEHKLRLFSGLDKLSQRLGRPLNIVEVGCGAGANFKYFPAGSRVTCVDPNRHFETYLRRECSRYEHIHLAEIHVCRAEDMSCVKPETADAVVCTLVLCSVSDVKQSLREIHRILRPGGQFYLLEHVVTAGSNWRRLAQRLVDVLWHRVFHFCCLQRDTRRSLLQAGFSDVQVEPFEAVELVKPTAIVFGAILFQSHIAGTATK